MPKFTLGHQICHESIGRTRVSIDSVVTLAHRLLCFRSYRWFCIENATFAHTTSSFTQNLEVFA